MSQALYRKYRSKSLNEVIGQQFITQTLANALKSETVSHAYLFTGPRGVGKTSIARILAHAINKLPYDGQTNHLDIIEIDAASNRRIDEIRELRDKVFIAPAVAPYKVYIIDEVHMLTKEAFNALLKTLEEPPEHAIFILATTEAHKVPETITSRTQRFSFRPVSSAELVSHLARIAKKENITIDRPALELIAEHSDGSVRDSLSLLDQVSAYGKNISEDDVAQLLGIPKISSLETLLKTITSGDTGALIVQLEALRSTGADDSQIALELVRLLRRQLLEQGTLDTTSLHLIERLLTVPNARHPDKVLELELLKLQLAKQPLPDQPKVKISSEPLPEPPKTATVAKRKETPKNKPAGWSAVLDDIKAKNSTFYSVLRMAKPKIQGDTLTLAFAFAFHEKQLKNDKYRQLLKDALASQQLAITQIETRVDKDLETTPPASTPAPAPAKDDTITSITNIFGSAEVLES